MCLIRFHNSFVFAERGEKKKIGLMEFALFSYNLLYTNNPWCLNVFLKIPVFFFMWNLTLFTCRKTENYSVTYSTQIVVVQSSNSKSKYREKKTLPFRTYRYAYSHYVQTKKINLKATGLFFIILFHFDESGSHYVYLTTALWVKIKCVML